MQEKSQKINRTCFSSFFYLKNPINTSEHSRVSPLKTGFCSFRFNVLDIVQVPDSTLK